MSTRVTLISHAPTAATAAAAFPADDPLDERGRVWAREGRGWLPRADQVRVGPDLASGQTCAVLGLAGEPDAALSRWDLGRWSGRSLDEVCAAQPEGVRAWLADPGAAPHGGEALTALLARVAEWLAALPPGHTLGVCSPAVIRAGIVAALGTPPSMFWRIDIAPLTLTDLRGGATRWTVRTTGAALGRQHQQTP